MDKTQPTTQNYTTPNQISQIQDAITSITKLLTQLTDFLNVVRREFRGEVLYEHEDGNTEWIQMSKPTFIKLDISSRKPIKQKKKMPWGEEREVYVPNDEAIDEILSMLKMMGINQIQPLGFNPSDNYLDDLLEFECKLAVLIGLKQEEWGLDEELLPMIQMKIKTIVQDIRSLSLEGKVLKALQTTVQRMEQFTESLPKNKLGVSSPYG